MKRNDLMSKKHNKIRKTLDQNEHILVLTSAFRGCISISVFASLVAIPLRTTSTSIRLKICVITATIKKCESIVKKRRKSMIKE